MITLTVISILYNIFALLRFKKLYGTYDIFSKSAKPWTVMIVLSFSYSVIVGIGLVLKYLP
jgi:hypothetical protein